jgi:DNA-binding MarR family transcriptional regulator
MYEHKSENFIWFDKIKKMAQRRQQDALKPYGLSSIHAMYLLMLLDQPDGLTFKELCEKRCVDKANTSRAVNVLEEKGYVFRDYTSAGVLKYKLILSEEGKNIAQEVGRTMKKFHCQLVEPLTEEEITTVRQVMFKIAKAVDDMENDKEE